MALFKKYYTPHYEMHYKLIKINLTLKKLIKNK